MAGFREFVTIALVECLISVGFPQLAQAMAAEERGGEFRQKLELLGSGAEVRVTLKGRQVALRGIVESIDDSAVRLRPGGTGEPKTVRYADVTLIEFTKTKYRAEGLNTDPLTVRRVAVELGIWRKVQVETQDRITLVGRIAKLEAEQIHLNLGEGGPVSVAYAQISELKPKRLNVAAKIAIGVGVAFGILLGVAMAICGSGGCS